MLSLAVISRPPLETKRPGPHQTKPGRRRHQWVDSARKSFKKVRFAKPVACKAHSSEPYLLASGFRMV
jgi:hypothetical protein